MPSKLPKQARKIIINIADISTKDTYFNIRQANNKAFTISLYKINRILKDQEAKETNTKKAN